MSFFLSIYGYDFLFCGTRYVVRCLFWGILFLVYSGMNLARVLFFLYTDLGHVGEGVMWYAG